MSIEKVTQGSLAKNGKLNEVIRAINSFINMEVREGAEGESVGLTYAQDKTLLITSGHKDDEDNEDDNSGFRSILICDSNVLKQASVMMDGEPQEV